MREAKIRKIIQEKISNRLGDERRRHPTYGFYMDEQDYVDKQFAKLTERIDELEEDVALDKAISVSTDKHDYILIKEGNHPPSWADIFWEDGETQRKRASQKGYVYTKKFKNKGELWIKKQKEKKDGSNGRVDKRVNKRRTRKS